MTSTELIGQVAARYLKKQVGGDDNEGTARFIVDCLTAEQTVATAQAILDDHELAGLFEIKMPAHFVGDFDLPPETLTEERTTYFRNASCEKPALLVANTGDDEEQSLRELVPVGAPQLLSHPELWVQVASQDLLITEEHQTWLEKAIKGLSELQLVSLERLANYVLRTRNAFSEEGQPILSALGVALPALQFPKDTAYFNGIKKPTHTYQWKRLYNNVQKRRACYLHKQNTSGLLLNEDDLRKSFKRVKDSIPDVHHESIQAFIEAPSGWNEAAAKLSEWEWEDIKPLFDGLRREKFNLGKATIDFYDEREPDLLTDDDEDYLERLIKRRTTERDDEDVQFYESHRIELRDDRKLKSAWDRFIYGKPLETEDFLLGLARCMESLFNQEAGSTKRHLHIRCESRTKRDFKNLNIDAGLYFERRYRGLKEMLGRRVSWKVGELFNFSELVDAWRQKKTKLNRSQAKAALRLKFLISLEVELDTGGSETYSTQLIWKYNSDWVSSELVADWDRLFKHPLVTCSAYREPINTKGKAQTVDLFDVKTFVPAYGQDRGSFVGVYKKENDIARRWQGNIEQAFREELITTELSERLLSVFERFKQSYSDAIRRFVSEGLSTDALRQQLEDFSALLHLICTEAKGDRNRELLLRPLLQIGTATVEGGQPTAVVTPWHPLRMAAMYQKASLVANLVKNLLTTEQVEFGDSRLFFRDLQSYLQHPFYPEIVLGWDENKPELLSLTDVAGDYSLHEQPLSSDDGLEETNENPKEGASQVLDLVKRYLALYPHEHANLSVVLYNCDSSRLPTAVVEKLSTLHENEDEVRCQVVLRHRDSTRLRSLYREIVETSDADPDAYNASEVTRDFMAQLRIGIMADEAPEPAPEDGRPADITFSQDVIARHARLEWYPVNADPVPLDELVPSRWSRRRPAAKDDMKSVVYLCAPAQSLEGWTFISALTTFLKGDWNGNEEQRLLPARQLDFQDPTTARIFEETHNLADWVVNFDELLDRRQLLNQNVRIIRYKQTATQGRNLIISSRAPLGLLKSMLLSRLKDLNLDLDDADYNELTRRFIADANDVSGDIVLRAAKRGRSASELIGVVLSRYLVKQELGSDKYFGWYFLDDYADWLGQREGQIADILALCPERLPDGSLRLAIVITEAKYVNAANLFAKRKESRKQLRDTVERINTAIFGTPERLDRDLWLARLSDLILDGVEFPASADLNLDDWRRAIRVGKCALSIRGYSHVFVSGPSGVADHSEAAALPDLENCYQEVYGRPAVRDLVLKYFNTEDPQATRQAIYDGKVPHNHAYQKPVKTQEPSPASPKSESAVAVPSSGSDPASALPSQAEISKQGEQPIDLTKSIVKQPEMTAVAQPSSTEETSTPILDAEEDAAETSPWSYPQIDAVLNDDYQDTAQTSDETTWLKQTEQRTKAALQQLHLRAKLVKSALTPNAALLKFEGSSNLTVEQVLKRQSQFLTTYGLNIISVQPEPGIVSLAVERPNRQIIYLKDLWKRWKPDIANGNQELVIGVREDDGSLLFLSPSKDHAPHTLIAGSTGSGKSVLMQNLILSIAATNTPDQAKIILIDPKLGVDYFTFEALPHLDGGIIDDQVVALQKIEELVAEMDARYRKLRSARVSNLVAYNANVPVEERLPFLWLIHDEFAEWMMVEDYKQNVAAAVGRLGVKARAAGIYLIFAAQRPDANVMPMQLRANLGNRLILRVDSEGTSDIALGEKGAEKLLGKGHLLAKLEGNPTAIYAQVPFADGQTMSAIVDTICRGTDTSSSSKWR